jgi:cytochrome oxidase Cu insertion factor (SCO1/SenC/PrrC family)
VNLLSTITRHVQPAAAIAVIVLAACSGSEQTPVQLGPVDGFDLAPTEIDRVTVGSMAPDFSLVDMDNDTLTLSDFRGHKNVVLVFYRGHW